MQESRSGSFVNFEVRDNFQHFRSESYVQALQMMSVSSPSFGDTRFGDDGASSFLKTEPVYRASSNDDTSGSPGHFNSAPSSPKQKSRDLQKSSTLPNHAVREIGFPKPKKSTSLSIGSFFKKLSPRIRRSKDKKGEKPWIVVEFSQSEIECNKDDSSGGSSQSIELATKSKETYIKSLVKDSSTKHSLSTKKVIARSANDITSGKTPISNLITDTSSSISFSLVENNPVHNKNITDLSNSSPRKSLQDLKTSKDSKRSSLIVFDPNSISNRTINSFSANKSNTKLRKEGARANNNLVKSTDDVLKDEHASQVCSNYEVTESPVKFVLESRSTELPSLLISKVPRQFLNSAESVKHSQENVSRAQPPKTLNLATSFVDSNCVSVKKMNSMESIGVCSLDADSTTHSEGSLSPSNDQNAIIDNYSSSAYTLKSTSLILSNGRLSPLSKLGNPELRVEQFGDVVDRAAPSLDREESTPDKQTNSLMGKTNPTNNLDPDHLPSYLGISCAISGYSGYSRYCHSRDNSPARVTSMNSSKLSIASSKYPQNRDIDSAINESTFINGKPRSKTDSYICNKYFGSTTLSNVKAESNRNYVSSQNITLRKNSPASKNYYSNGLNGHHALSGEPKGRDEIRKVEFSTPGYEFDGRVDLTSEEPKSLVQQRIESLYGQPAGQVVQGGGIRLSRAKSRTPVDGNIANRSPSCPPQTFRPSSRSPPVFRHITKDFKEQLRNATVPTKIIPLKPQLSPNKQCASLTISPVAKKPLQNAFDSPSKQLLRASSEPKNLFPAALSVVPPLEEKNLVSPKEEIVSISVEIKKDGHYFLKMMAGTIEGFRSQIEQAKADADLPGVPEEAHGKLLSAVGLANLLIDSKFSQFRGLCEKNITPDDSEPFPTTNEDLAGFWDMLQYQVNKINEAFSNLRKLKERQWVEEEYEETVPYSRSKSHKKSQPKCNAKASVSNPTTPKHSSKANELAKARLEQRKKLMEAKKRGRQQNPGDADILIFTPDQAMDLK